MIISYTWGWTVGVWDIYIIMCTFDKNYFCQLIFLFSLFLLLFIALFGTIHESHYIISTNFYHYSQYFQQKIFRFSKISGSQKWTLYITITQNTNLTPTHMQTKLVKVGKIVKYIMKVLKLFFLFNL